MSRPSDPWRLLFAASVLAANAGVTALPAGWKTHSLAPDLQDSLQWIAHEWKEAQTQRAFAGDCERQALRWYWVCDSAE